MANARVRVDDRRVEKDLASINRQITRKNNWKVELRSGHSPSFPRTHHTARATLSVPHYRECVSTQRFPSSSIHLSWESRGETHTVLSHTFLMRLLFLFVFLWTEGLCSCRLVTRSVRGSLSPASIRVYCECPRIRQLRARHLPKRHVLYNGHHRV